MNKLWYTEAAKDWNEALPVGNGRLAAMVYGRADHEIIQLNEESVWSGKYKNRNNKSCKKALPKIRKLMNEGRVQDAQALSYEVMTGCPANQAVYQTAGDLHIDYYTEETAGLLGPTQERHNTFPGLSMYRRELNLDEAIVTTSFLSESKLANPDLLSRSAKGYSVSYKREVFVPAGLNVIVIHVSASSPKSIYLRANFNRGSFSTKNIALTDDTIEMEDTHGIPFSAVAMAQASGGKVFTRGNCLIVEAADEVTIFVDIQTAFRRKHYARKGGNVRARDDFYASLCKDEALKNVCFASAVPYPKILSNHIAEYGELFNRVKLTLNGDEKDSENIPTDKLLSEKSESLALAQLYWNFDRYLLISSSRSPATLPANLQGKWAKDMDPPWGSKYTININTEMNYWPANMCGLEETEMPLFELLKRVYKNGKTTASEMYGADGFVAHHNVDIWGDTAPQDEWLPGTYWVLGAAWLATHIREHYEYTQDKKFLKKYFFYMKRACDFFVDYLSPSADGKHLIINPSVSPENSYILPNGEQASFSAGTDMDNRILEHLFAATIQSAADLKISEKNADIAQYKEVLSKIEGVAVTEHGTIREWPVKCQEVEPGHRHISQLYGLFPGHAIDFNRTPELAKAAAMTIQRRLENGGGHTGWSQAWIMNFRASLHDKVGAYKSLIQLFQKSTLPNLFDNHPPFQIDGNFGSLCAMTRFIVQSQIVDGSVEINLLPALPDAWKSGSIEGVNLKGNLAMNLQWADGRIVKGNIYRLNPDEEYIEDIVLYLGQHSYHTYISDGKIDLLNALPSTL